MSSSRDSKAVEPVKKSTYRRWDPKERKWVDEPVSTVKAYTPPAPPVNKDPSDAVVNYVHRAFRPKKLKAICELDQQQFGEYGTYHDLGVFRGDPHFYWYQDNGADVLGIAHLDTVQKIRDCSFAKTNAGLIVYSGGLDDRLGAYVILELLPALGIKVDWLLTTNEECCNSSAADFKLADVGVTKQYNWMFQFDRGGTDVVMYQYETQPLKRLVEESGARVGNGSFSDICQLAHLGCVGFNWGVGYQQYHTAKSHAWLDDTLMMVARFYKFYWNNHNDFLVYEKPKNPTGRYWRGSGGKTTYTYNADNDEWGWGGDGMYWSKPWTKKDDSKKEPPPKMEPGVALDEKEWLADYEAWWREQNAEWVKADCDHYILPDDEATFVKEQECVVCRACGLEFGWSRLPL